MISIKLLLCVSSLVLVVAADDRYTDKYDNINLDEILENKRLFMSYANCVLDKGKCNAEGKELREHIEEALSNGCEKCTETQRKGAKKVIEHSIKNEPEIWLELTNKYDPSGNFRKKYEDEARQNGIVIPSQ